MKMKWAGVMPATTTAFDEDLKIDHAFVGQHAKWLIDHGCTGIVTPGSLGESATLSFDEKLAIWKTVIGAVSGACGRPRLQWLDGVAAVRLPQRLARNESAH